VPELVRNSALNTFQFRFSCCVVHNTIRHSPSREANLHQPFTGSTFRCHKPCNWSLTWAIWVQSPLPQLLLCTPRERMQGAEVQSLMHNFGRRRRGMWVVNITLRPLYPRGKESMVFAEENIGLAPQPFWSLWWKYLLLALWIELFLARTAGSIVTTPTMVDRSYLLSYFHFNIIPQPCVDIPSGLSPSGVMPKNLYAFLVFPYALHL